MKPFRIPLLFSLLLLISCGRASQVEVRTMRYYPDGRDIVCLNGDGLYTRALYGTHTRYRLETGDRPRFVAYDRENSYNFRFFLDGKRLDSGDFRCEARYQGGRRSYSLTAPEWGEGKVDIVAMASFFGEGAIWKINTTGFDHDPALAVRRCRTAATRFNREGDLGNDPQEGFEPAEGEPELITLEWDGAGETYLVYEDNSRLFLAEDGPERFAKEEEARQALVGTVEINTPDPWLNTLGASMLAAADGCWDGETFLHGAIGWRTRLAGWRGAYALDALGWNDRALSHFRAYAASMVTDCPPSLPQPQQDSARNLARGLEELGTPIFSNGYICKLPGRTDVTSHYDMNLNYIDELLTHFGYDADTSFMREMWPVIKLHLEWEKRNFDPDGDHLYDAYCCIWASDALFYSGGAVTHSSAYNYRGNLLAARIAEIIGEDPAPYRAEAEAILAALNSRLWMEDKGYWAEYQDYAGLKRLHESAAIWTIYTPIDCGACTPEQAWRATRYVDRSIPHIPVRYRYDEKTVKELGLQLPAPEEDLFTVSTSDWLPYVWSTNNVAHEEVANMALAYLQAGRSDSGFKLLKADILDEMYLGACPGNFGQISYYDKAKSEAYRDFADNVGITTRAVINGLFGIIPEALYGRCIIRQAFPAQWQEASIKTPYLSYSFRREGTVDVYEITQHFNRPLKIVVQENNGGAYLEVEGSTDSVQTIRIDRRDLPPAPKYKEAPMAKDVLDSPAYMAEMGLGDITRRTAARSRMVDISAAFNSNADDIFRNEYLSPRPPFTTLQLPKQGVGEWCIPLETYEIEDDGLRARIKDGVFDTGLGLRFKSPAEGPNIVYTSLWDNYPGSVSIPLEGRARHAWLMMAGSTENMQSRIDNGMVTVTYTDGSTSSMPLYNPVNWYPIHQDYYLDDYAFRSCPVRPYRVLFADGSVSRNLDVKWGLAEENERFGATNAKPTDRIIPSGAGIILKMPLDGRKDLRSLTLTTLSGDVVIGLMAITLEN